MQPLSLSFVALSTVTIAVTSCTVTPNDYAESSIEQHTNWIHSCTDSSIAVSQRGLNLYSFDVKPNSDRVIHCLLSDRDLISESFDSWRVITYPSLFDSNSLGDGPPRQMLEALLKVDGKVLIVSAADSDEGVTKVIHVSGDAFIVQTGYATHERNYLVYADSSEFTYLPNGDVEIADEEGFVFSVKDSKSYFNRGGAFWFDALVNRDGQILDIVTPGGDCMSRDKLVAESGLDLSRVMRHEICIQR